MFVGFARSALLRNFSRVIWFSFLQVIRFDVMVSFWLSLYSKVVALGIKRQLNLLWKII